MVLDKNKLVPQLWTLTILFYLLRSIAEPLKYVFVLTFGILIITYSYFLLLNFRKKTILKYIHATKEFLILGIFLTIGIILSTQTEILAFKSLINFIGITILFLIYYEFKDHIQLNKAAIGWVILTVIIGLLGFLKWLNYIFGLDLEFFSRFYRYGTSLVSDYNVFAIYFVGSIIIYLYAIQKEIVKSKLVLNQLVLFFYIINISLTGSRRGIILLAILVLVSTLILFLKRKEKKGMFLQNLAYLNILVFSLVFLMAAFVPFRTKLIRETSTRFKITSSIYRYATLFIPNITYSIFYDELWPRSANYKNDKTNWLQYATYNNVVDGIVLNNYHDLKNEYWVNFEEKERTDNLLYNGNFKLGHRFWEFSTTDSIKHELINAEYGNALRVSRLEGNGNWPLLYTGRKIIYYKGVTYTFKFKYRVIKGEGRPFMIGWWINEGKGFINNLNPKIKALDNGWYEFTASYTFRKNQQNIPTFMNSQHANTVIDFTDIELTSNDTLNRPKYLDQLIHLEGANLFYNSNFENGLKFWGKMTPDTIIHKLIDTQYGKAIRVARKEGVGYWPLIYQGRDIYYYKNLTYTFRFKFRVIEGRGAPFQIGWWAIKEDPIPYNLHKEIFPISDGWYECIASYTFKNDTYRAMTTFLNSLQANTIIDVADIELLCNDTLNRPMYADERIDVISAHEEARIKKQLGEEKAGILHERAARWKYALDLWRSEYQLSNKIFGKGFDYLEKFGQKFHPDQERIDYPHNPIISSFLYSGIIGGIFYLYFLALSFWYYWKYRKHHMLFFILYLITFTFVFISSDSHFNVPIFAVLSLVPFITKHIVKEKEQTNPA